MANQDDTSKLPRRRRNQARDIAEAPFAAGPVSAGSNSAPPSGANAAPPRTLEEAIEHARALLLEVRGMLHVLSDVLLYADDEDSVLHAEVAQAASGWINDAAAQLDLVKLRPLIEAIQRRDKATSDEETSSDDEWVPGNRTPDQVGEPMAVYYAA